MIARRDLGVDGNQVLETGSKIASGALRGPRLLATGCGIIGRGGHPAATVFRGNPWARARFAAEVDSARQMRDVVHLLADQGVDAIKLLSEGTCADPGSPAYAWRVPAFPDEVELVRLRRGDRHRRTVITGGSLSGFR
ncbi:amidohydrolase family protein [Saccharopolyspora terrae]|uniref:hypothetical protein n=1 Tax=Saccharopolyspora terrae TaxID=2530384 RepID=UPI001A9E2EA9|nr:hypothetical protein [Saccharopolyspora terrae]